MDVPGFEGIWYQNPRYRQGCCGLGWQYAVAESVQLSSEAELVARVCDLAKREPHQPLHGLWRRSWSARSVQDRRRWGCPTGDALPSGESWGVPRIASQRIKADLQRYRDRIRIDPLRAPDGGDAVCCAQEQFGTTETNQ